MNRTLAILVLLPFTALSTVAMIQHGYVGIWRVLLASTAAWQILFDITIAFSLISVWIWHDAQLNQRQPLPWIIATFLTGSFAPMLYLITGRKHALSIFGRPHRPGESGL